MSMLVFAIVQFINVVLGTLRSICTIKANKHVGMFINVIAFTFYAAVVKLTNEQDMWYVLTITAITNCAGFYLAQFIFTKSQKDKVWRIVVTIPDGVQAYKVMRSLENYHYEYSLNQSLYKNKTVNVLHIYSQTQADSENIKMILNMYKCHNISVFEVEKKL